MRTWSYPSKSNPNGKPHVVTLHDDGRLVCTCRGFRTPDKCWHIKAAGDELVRGGPGVIALPPIVGRFSSTPNLKIVGGSGAPAQPSLLGASPEIPVRPMLASGLKEGWVLDDYVDADHILEVKYDGHRIILEVGAEITAWSRAGNVRILGNHIREVAAHLAPGIYDGELCIPGGTSTDVTSIDLLHKSELILFDMLRVGPNSALGETTAARRDLLEEGASLISPGAIRLADQFEVSELALQRIWDAGGEGAIIKDLKALYEEDHRSRSWIKIKKEQFVICKIVGFVAGLLGPHSKISCVDEFGVEVQVKTLNDEWRRVFATESTRFIGKEIRINYQQKTNTGRYRHPMADHIIGEVL